MKNTYFQAYLESKTRIKLLLFTGIVLPNNPSFFLEIDNEKPVKLKVFRHISNNSVSIYELDMEKEFVYGRNYVIVLESFPRINIDVSNAVDFPGFDDEFYYDGEDLGAIYSKEETKFNLWAPIATKVYLKIEENGQFVTKEMTRGDKGVYHIALKGDYLNARYHYLVTNSGILNETNDPWGKGVSFNSEYSVVVDINEIKKMKKIIPSNKVDGYHNAIIYETSIRDFTEDKNTDIVNKGKYLGMVEKGRKTSGNHPSGLDYLKYLGITHVQILPVIDFYGNDDKDSSLSYNWGYNPISFFAVEGSYSSKPEDAMNRLFELRKMVDEFHKNDIRVNMDVVYNHLYEFMYTSFEKVVPSYFYRKRTNGLVACASGCGDDYASERKMARKAVIESLKYFTDVFDVDGFRFDLMGLMDIETINTGYKECQKIKNDIMFYGEGWNMGIELPMKDKACSDNADQMPNIAFFNDTFRDILRGGNFRDNITEKGYVGGNLSRQDAVNYVLNGSTIDVPFRHRFLDYNQSLNYVECHDNNTLYDKLTFSNEGEDETRLLSRVEFANKLVLLSFGIPFIHMGQEIGLSKNGLDNTYNVLKVNNMDWKLVDERFEMVTRLAEFIKLRKELFYKFTKISTKEIPSKFTTQYWNNGMMALCSDKHEFLTPYKKMAVLINPTLDKQTYELDEYYKLVVNAEDKGEAINMKNGIIAPLDIQLLYIK